jgi:hypothetical protein
MSISFFAHGNIGLPITLFELTSPLICRLLVQGLVYIHSFRFEKQGEGVGCLFKSENLLHLLIFFFFWLCNIPPLPLKKWGGVRILKNMGESPIPPPKIDPVVFYSLL